MVRVRLPLDFFFRDVWDKNPSGAFLGIVEFPIKRLYDGPPRNAFDVGEYAVGRMASPLEARIDAPENAVLFHAVFADESGKPYTLQRAVGLYERDGGILYLYDRRLLDHLVSRGVEVISLPPRRPL